MDHSADSEKPTSNDEFDFIAMNQIMVAVRESAAHLQAEVPEATLVGGSAAALYANHRSSYDHGHAISDLKHRFEAVREALESDPDWVTNRVTPGKIILGQIGDIEAGVDKERFGQKFSTLLQEADITQAEAAAYLGTSRTRVNSYCTGAVAPSAILVSQLRRVIAARRDMRV